MAKPTRYKRRAVVCAFAAIIAATFATFAARFSRRMKMRDRPADLGFMYAMHAAMRRDLSRLEAVATRLPSGGTAPAPVRDGWHELRRELDFHHEAEDDDLWPMLRARAHGEEVNATINDMVREHQLIPSALDAVERGLNGEGSLSMAVDALVTRVEEHLDHEERAALPLVERHLSDAEWHEFLHAERRRRPGRERPTFLTWVLDEAAPVHAEAVLRELPPPGRLVYRHVLKPRYDARRLWSLEGTRTAPALVTS